MAIEPESPTNGSSRLVPDSENLYRALNPKHYDAEGFPAENHFLLKAGAQKGEGLSAGIASEIPLESFRTLSVLEASYGPGFGVAEFNIAEALRPFRDDIGLFVEQQPEESWGEYAHAHAVITGHQHLGKNRDAKRKTWVVARHLANLARGSFNKPRA
jgi:hypothetical protein